MSAASSVLPAGKLGSFRGGSGFPVRYQGKKSGELPFFKVSDMNSDGNELFMIRANNYISETRRKALGAVRIPAQAIVFAKVGAAVFQERKRILAQDSCIDNNMAAFIVDTGKLDVRFAHYLLTAFTMSDLVAVGALPSLNGGQLRSIPLLVPDDLGEQRRIVAALADADDLIATLERLIAKKQAIRQGMMQQLLTGRTRLPGFDGEWSELTLGDVARFSKGMGLPKSAIVPGGHLPCVHYGELFTRYGPEIGFVTSRTNDLSLRVRSVGNDVLMPTSDVTPRGLAKASAIGLDGVVLGGDILVIRPNRQQVFGPFLAHAIRHDANQVLQLVRGSTVYHLYASDMKTFRLALPNVDEQRQISEVLRDAEHEIEVLRNRLMKANAVKSGMMQQLLTGRTRLPSEVRS